MKVLVIDDDRSIRETLGMTLETQGHAVTAVATGAAALKRLQEGGYEAAFLDIRLTNESGLDLLPELLRLSPRLAVVVMTAYTSIETAVEAIRKGAFEYLSKPFKPAQVARVFEQLGRVRSLELQVAELESRAGVREAAPVSADPAVAHILQIAMASAASDASILILGETGTGKTQLARQIHQASLRRDEPFVTVSCPSLSRELLESELFGHAKGAFTGAVAATWGKVAAADRGTLFLDEIGELPLEIQPKLLRFLQDKEYERVGDPQVRRADVRVIAATHRDLKDAVRRGTFREDLLYRIDVISLAMPPLRERPADLAGAADVLLEQFARRMGKALAGFTAEARRTLAAYAWPGNFRELRNVIERAAILAPPGEVGAEHLPAALGGTAAVAPSLGGPFSIAQVEGEHIRRVLQSGRSIQECATLLQIDPTTLLRRRKQFGLD